MLFFFTILESDFFRHTLLSTRTSMNCDIIYEILKILYLAPEENGGVLLAKKIILSVKSLKLLESRKLEKPIVFTVEKKPMVKFDPRLMMYYQNNIIKIFGECKKFKMPQNTLDVYSIGDIKDLSSMLFGCALLNPNVGKKWDTSGVTDMSYMLYGCANLVKNIGTNWNVSEVVYMDGMFTCCYGLKKNIGNNWDTSKVLSMINMFSACIKLRSVGKKWNLSNLVRRDFMFARCTKLDNDTRKKWGRSL